MSTDDERSDRHPLEYCDSMGDGASGTERDHWKGHSTVSCGLSEPQSVSTRCTRKNPQRRPRKPFSRLKRWPSQPGQRSAPHPSRPAAHVTARVRRALTLLWPSAPAQLCHRRLLHYGCEASHAGWPRRIDVAVSTSVSELCQEVRTRWNSLEGSSHRVTTISDCT